MTFFHIFDKICLKYYHLLVSKPVEDMKLLVDAKLFNELQLSTQNSQFG